MRNETTYSLENTATRMLLLRDWFTIEILYKPSIPDNINNLYFFYDDQYILYFMANYDVFKKVAIDENKHMYTLQDTTTARKGNLIPEGVVSLENLYDLQNYFGTYECQDPQFCIFAWADYSGNKKGFEVF